jgi:hypothetical protein
VALISLWVGLPNISTFCFLLSPGGGPGIALLLAHCLAARPLPPAYGLGDGAKPPENRQN